MSYGIRVCIGGTSTDWYSTAAYGGVAYLGSFDLSSDTPCFVFSKSLSDAEKYVAEAISHEVGHTLGLYHDGTSTLGYYTGHGSGADGWAPIMGVGYYKPVVQFSRGEYLDANNKEDDLSIITSSYNFPYIPDDFGNSFQAATSAGSASFYVDGFIERNPDVDMFQFSAASGLIDIQVDVDARSPNLNVEASLYDSNQALVATGNPADSLGADIYLPGMPAGTYYLKVRGAGSGSPLDTGYSSYGSIGIYSITANIPASGAPVNMATVVSTSGGIPLTVEFSAGSSYDPDGTAVSYFWDLGNGATSTDANPISLYSSVGTYTPVLTVFDAAGLSTARSLSISVQDPLPSAPSALSAAVMSSTRVDLKWTDNSGNETGFTVERSTDGILYSQVALVGANVTQCSDTTVSDARTYTYRVQAYNGSGASAFSAGVTVSTPAALPKTPGSLSARALSKTQINLKWSDLSSNESGFYVEASLNGVSWSRIGTPGANTTGFSASGLTANTLYYFRVQAFNSVGVSAYSGVTSTKTKR